MKKILVLLLLVSLCSCTKQKAKDNVRELFRTHETYRLAYNHEFIDISNLESCTDRDLKYYLLDYYNSYLEFFKKELANSEALLNSANDSYAELINTNDEWALEHKKYLRDASISNQDLVKRYNDSIKCVKERIVKLSSLEVDGKKRIMQKTTVVYNEKNSRELWDVYLDKDLKIIEHERLLLLAIQKFIDSKAIELKVCN